MAVEQIEKILDFCVCLGGALYTAQQQTTVVGKIGCMLPVLEDLTVLASVNYTQLEADVKALSPEDLTALGAYLDQKGMPGLSSVEKDKVENVVNILLDLAKVMERAVKLWRP